MRANLLAASAIVALSVGGAFAQSDQPGAAPPAQPGQVQATQPQTGQARQGDAADERQVAQRCLDDLGALEARMNEEGFWLTGWRGGATMGPAAPGAAGMPPAGAAGVGAGGTAPPPDPGAAMGVGEAGAGPWGGVGWADAPRHELRALHTAAVVLGRRGDEQACQAVLGELAEMYDRYVGELRAAGVEPGQITDWRSRELAAAKPVAELGPRVRLDDVTGTDVRNRADEHLGSVDDVLLDPRGGISHVVVARGGFLGLGQTRVAVPWEKLQATPGLNTFVLDVGEDVMAAAPEVDPDALGDPETYEQRRQEIDRFWQQHAG
jgi:sporulation protein YlmC with PRC-barrel domain